MKKEEIENDVNELIKKNSLQKVNDTLYLTNYQVEVLNDKHIPYHNCASVQEVLFLLNDIIDEDDLDELELVATELSEFSYYHESHK